MDFHDFHIDMNWNYNVAGTVRLEQYGVNNIIMCIMLQPGSGCNKQDKQRNEKPKI